MSLTVAFWDTPVSHDVAWQMWIARQMLHGAQLYVDIPEVNPPLWFWAALPVQWAAETLGLTSRAAIMVFGNFLIGLSCLFMVRLWHDETHERRIILLVAAMLALVLAPLRELCQREHMALIGALPYALLIARRAEGKPVSTGLALAIGILAAFGFALKHYFALVPIVLEVWLIARHRPRWRLLRPETVVMACMAVAYVVATALITPAFFEMIVPMLRETYSGFERHFRYVVFRIWVSPWVIGAAALIWVRHKLPASCVAVALAACAFAVSYFVQKKGWYYHGMSASGAFAFVLTLAAALRPIPWHRGQQAALLVALLYLCVLAIARGTYTDRSQFYMHPVLGLVQPGDRVAVLTMHPTMAWPHVLDARYVLPVRYYHFWMLPTLAKTPEEERSPALKAISAQMLRETRDDLWCLPPKLIVTDHRPSKVAPRSFNIARYFTAEPAIAELFSHYRVAKVENEIAFWVQKSEIAPRKYGRCRPVI